MLLVLGLVSGLGWKYYHDIYGPNVKWKKEEPLYLYIPTGSDFNQLVQIIEEEGWLKNTSSFKWVAGLKEYDQKVKPGRYLLEHGMSNNELVNSLRLGSQAAVKVTFNNARTMSQLAGKLTRHLEVDSASLDAILGQDSTAHRYGFQPEQFPAMFIPNTYQIYWTTTPEELLDRMAREFKTFWTPERKKLAAGLGLSQSEVATLASIVEEETQMRDERSRVAGVYLNRLNRGMLLQADPTLKFAAGDFTIKRVLNKHKAIDSPYNTYKYTGLPPGPIRIPDQHSIDAVLNAEKHGYLYFCAKSDFSGYHDFAKTYNEHLKNARRYHSALNKRGI
ncbi:endolytic transglycosylase MltG [bacterium SCSIO 12741]|nr:endolytic transglycosylase MltG [bacterium SCSIO 12741]